MATLSHGHEMRDLVDELLNAPWDSRDSTSSSSDSLSPRAPLADLEAMVNDEEEEISQERGQEKVREDNTSDTNAHQTQFQNSNGKKAVTTAETEEGSSEEIVQSEFIGETITASEEEDEMQYDSSINIISVSVIRKSEQQKVADNAHIEISESERKKYRTDIHTASNVNAAAISMTSKREFHKTRENEELERSKIFNIDEIECLTNVSDDSSDEVLGIFSKKKGCNYNVGENNDSSIAEVKLKQALVVTPENNVLEAKTKESECIMVKEECLLKERAEINFELERKLMKEEKVEEIVMTTEEHKKGHQGTAKGENVVMDSEFLPRRSLVSIECPETVSGTMAAEDRGARVGTRGGDFLRMQPETEQAARGSRRSPDRELAGMLQPHLISTTKASAGVSVQSEEECGGSGVTLSAVQHSPSLGVNIDNGSGSACVNGTEYNVVPSAEALEESTLAGESEWINATGCTSAFTIGLSVGTAEVSAGEVKVEIHVFVGDRPVNASVNDVVEAEDGLTRTPNVESCVQRDDVSVTSDKVVQTDSRIVALPPEKSISVHRTDVSVSAGDLDVIGALIVDDDFRVLGVLSLRDAVSVSEESSPASVSAALRKGLASTLRVLRPLSPPRCQTCHRPRQYAIGTRLARKLEPGQHAMGTLYSVEEPLRDDGSIVTWAGAYDCSAGDAGPVLSSGGAAAVIADLALDAALTEDDVTSSDHVVARGNTVNKSTQTEGLILWNASGAQGPSETPVFVVAAEQSEIPDLADSPGFVAATGPNYTPEFVTTGLCDKSGFVVAEELSDIPAFVTDAVVSGTPELVATAGLSDISGFAAEAGLSDTPGFEVEAGVSDTLGFVATAELSDKSGLVLEARLSDTPGFVAEVGLSDIPRFVTTAGLSDTSGFVTEAGQSGTPGFVAEAGVSDTAELRDRSEFRVATGLNNIPGFVTIAGINDTNVAVNVVEESTTQESGPVTTVIEKQGAVTEGESDTQKVLITEAGDAQEAITAVALSNTKAILTVEKATVTPAVVRAGLGDIDEAEKTAEISNRQKAVVAKVSDKQKSVTVGVSDSQVPAGVNVIQKTAIEHPTSDTQLPVAESGVAAENNTTIENEVTILSDVQDIIVVNNAANDMSDRDGYIAVNNVVSDRKWIMEPYTVSGVSGERENMRENSRVEPVEWAVDTGNVTVVNDTETENATELDDFQGTVTDNVSGTEGTIDTNKTTASDIQRTTILKRGSDTEEAITTGVCDTEVVMVVDDIEGAMTATAHEPAARVSTRRNGGGASLEPGAAPSGRTEASRVPGECRDVPRDPAQSSGNRCGDAMRQKNKPSDSDATDVVVEAAAGAAPDCNGHVNHHHSTARSILKSVLKRTGSGGHHKKGGGKAPVPAPVPPPPPPPPQPAPQKKKHRVQFDESKNKFFDADYVILIREEEEEEEEEEDLEEDEEDEEMEEDEEEICTCGASAEMGRMRPPVVGAVRTPLVGMPPPATRRIVQPPGGAVQVLPGNIPRRDATTLATGGPGFDLNIPENCTFEPPLEFIDQVTLSPPEGYKDVVRHHHPAPTGCPL
ncbi:uncharacterized protein [Periplaneta americana]|uniref:uncharacterized protein n=1 Tax=Periplaneta americana TaxID=6978 RepID=UPI0037E8207E